MVVGDIPQLAPALPEQYRRGKEFQLRRLYQLRAMMGPLGEDVLNARGLALLDMAIVETLVSLRRIEGL